MYWDDIGFNHKYLVIFYFRSHIAFFHTPKHFTKKWGLRKWLGRGLFIWLYAYGYVEEMRRRRKKNAENQPNMVVEIIFFSFLFFFYLSVQIHIHTFSHTHATRLSFRYKHVIYSGMNNELSMWYVRVMNFGTFSEYYIVDFDWSSSTKYMCSKMVIRVPIYSVLGWAKFLFFFSSNLLRWTDITFYQCSYVMYKP